MILGKNLTPQGSDIMSKSETSELIKLRQQAQQAEIKERQALLDAFLGNVKKMIKDQATLHLPKTTVDEAQRAITIQPVCFYQLRLGG